MLPYWILAVAAYQIRNLLVSASDKLIVDELVRNPDKVMHAYLRGLLHSVIPFEPSLISLPHFAKHGWFLELRSGGSFSVIAVCTLLALVVGYFCIRGFDREKIGLFQQTLIWIGIISITLVPYILLGMSISGRYTYLPSLAATFLIGVWLHHLAGRIRRLILFPLLGLIIAVNFVQLYLLQLQIFSY